MYIANGWLMKYIVLHRNLKNITYLNYDNNGEIKKCVETIVTSTNLDIYDHSTLMRVLDMYGLVEEYDKVVQSRPNRSAMTLTYMEYDDNQPYWQKFDIVEIKQYAQYKCEKVK